jgi:hypothetical protein
MTPNNKAVFPFVSLFLVLMTIACTISSSAPSGATPTAASGGSTPGGKGAAAASPTTAAAAPAGKPTLEQVSNQG